MATNDDADLGQDPDDGDLENLHTTYDCLDRALMLGEPAEVRLAAETALGALGEFLNRTPATRCLRRGQTWISGGNDDGRCRRTAVPGGRPAAAKGAPGPGERPGRGCGAPGRRQRAPATGRVKGKQNEAAGGARQRPAGRRSRALTL
jgi:hypothetical protein